MRLARSIQHLRMSILTFGLIVLFALVPIIAWGINEPSEIISKANPLQPQILDGQGRIVQWNILTRQYANNPYAYTPFLMEASDKIRFFTGGGGLVAGNGILELRSNLSGSIGLSQRKVIAQGPNQKELNYFRGVRLAQSGSEIWVMSEVSRCYSGGCDLTGAVKRYAVYRSIDDGAHWVYQGIVKLNGQELEGDWMAHTGLIFNPKASAILDLNDPTQNRFITIGTNSEIYVSADGLNYQSIPIQTPFEKDRQVFASLAKTPKGFHIMTGSNWVDGTGVSIIRHLFSRDLRVWHSIETESVLKNPHFYKGVHLSYDEKSGFLWAFSPCGSSNACGILAYLLPRDYVE